MQQVLATGRPTGTATGTGSEPTSDVAGPPPDDAGADSDAALSCAGLDPNEPVVLYLSADDSSSMGGASIERERAVVTAVAQSLMAGDIVNMVTWSINNNVLLSGHSVSGPNDGSLLAAAQGLTANGGTNLEQGLVAGYQLADPCYGQTRLNRVILVSDGGANVGVTDEALIALHSEDADREGIYLVGVGTGPAQGYNDLLAASKDQLEKGKAIVAYAEALKTGAPADLAAALQAVLSANLSATDPELDEIADLIQLHPSYVP